MASPHAGGTQAFDLHFGGPGLPRGGLRDLLARRVAETPAGGCIDWICYYFRDRRLAADLVAARRRGVAVRLCLAAKPRIADANEAALRLLAGADGLGDGLRLVCLPGLPAPGGKSWRPQLHEKLYVFSHPEPMAYIGSFNPAGDEPEERPDIVREIGDHNLSHNLLLGLRDAALAAKLQSHARALHGHPPGLLHRFGRRAGADFRRGGTSVHFWPRLRPHPLLRLLRRFGSGARVRIAASHIRAGAGIRAIEALVRRGAQVEILGEATRRRAPERAGRRLAAAGAAFRRIGDGETLLMHLKFALLEGRGERWSMLGSCNWTHPSFWLNHEIAVISDDLTLFESLGEHWRRLQGRGGEEPRPAVASGAQPGCAERPLEGT